MKVILNAQSSYAAFHGVAEMWLSVTISHDGQMAL